MFSRRVLCCLAALAVTGAACSDTETSSVAIPGDAAAAPSADTDTAGSGGDDGRGDDGPASSGVPDSTGSGDDTTDDSASDDTGPGTTDPDDASDTSSSSPSTSTTTSTTTTSSTTTTTTEPEPELDVYDPACVVEVVAGDSLGLIVERFDDETVNIATVRAENGIEGSTIYPDQLLDVCVDNGLDDVSGSERTERNAAIAEGENAQSVAAQQEQLNALLTPFGMRELLVDGVSGPVTRRHLCAARVGLGLDVTLADMEPGSEEETALMEATEIRAPFTSALNEDRWIVIDRTCQVMFVGQGTESLDFVWPTSTGSVGFETRDQDRSGLYRYDPAIQNDGWHNSTDYPVPVDAPLSGNMYKPLYFDGGQAIHGANNVPTTPQSKGCARLSPAHQDTLVTWLGLAGATGPQGGVGASVNVQGAYPHEVVDPETPTRDSVDT